jgi:antitoxin component of RelBE/YafQ-DinJ toxin-antitoxin module
MTTNTTYNIRIDKQVREQAAAPLHDAAEIDMEINNGTAKIYTTKEKMFKA